LLWLSLIAIYAMVLLLSVPRSFYTVRSFRALASIPSLMFAMLKAVLKMKANRKEFLHTPKVFKP